MPGMSQCVFLFAYPLLGCALHALKYALLACVNALRVLPQLIDLGYGYSIGCNIALAGFWCYYCGIEYPDIIAIVIPAAVFPFSMY